MFVKIGLSTEEEDEEIGGLVYQCTLPTLRVLLCIEIPVGHVTYVCKRPIIATFGSCEWFHNVRA